MENSMYMEANLFKFSLDPTLSYEKQIEDRLAQIIRSGVLSVNVPLPTVRGLAAQLGVNHNTVARAYRALEEQGLLSTRQGRGTYLRETHAADEEHGQRALPATIYQFLQQLKEKGFSEQQIQDAFRKAIQAYSATPSHPVQRTSHTTPIQSRTKQHGSGRSSIKVRYPANRSKRFIKGKYIREEQG